LAGAYAGGAAYASWSMFTSIGNSVYFHDPFPTGQQLLAGLGISMLTAGFMNGITDPNYDFIGLRATPVQVESLPLPNPVGVTVKDLNLPTNIGDNLSEVNSTNDFQSAPQGTPDAANPMQGKVMTTVRGLDGKVSYVFKDVSTDIRPTVDRIASGERLPYRNDGSVFMNKEGLLPKQDVGYYKEFVHPTPNVLGPGAMRIVTGQEGEMWFTFDHYRTFIPIQ
jgi:guanyl-specific ribonuclease Sa